jgi:aryl-alcohol dehydrogenase-like predicted oxidoreductase
MNPTRPPSPDDPGPTRRTFLNAGTTALLLGGAAAMSRPGGASAAPRSSEADVEWRNKQPGMSYRRLGRTGMMISEVVSGGDPITSENFKHLALAIEMGLNYLDMAPAYHKGDTERAYGKLLAGSPGLRQKVFLTTKVSDLTRRRDQMYKEIFDGLPSSKQEAIRERAKALRQERGVEAPGYYLTYFPGQQRAFDPAYLRVAMMPEYGHRVEGCAELRKLIADSLEGSLGRVGTDHFDILMCPHGANCPEDLSPEIAEVFADLKRQGKVRFLGVTAHNDPAGVLRAATAAGHYDVVMMAYNVINGGYLAEAIRQAADKDVGLIAMKAAHAVATHHKPLQPIPDWRVAKIERIVPGDWKAPQKAYLWALQNPHIAAVISNLWDETFVRENLALAGKKVELRPA